MQAAAFDQHSLPLVHANLVLWQPYGYKCHNSILVGRQGFPSSVDTRCHHRVRNPRLTGCGHPLGNLHRNLQKNLKKNLFFSGPYEGVFFSWICYSECDL